MAATRATIASVALLASVAGISCSDQKTRQVTLVVTDHRQGTAPGNSPVKIVGGSMTFRAAGGWAPTDATKPAAGWTTNKSINISAIELEQVVSASSSSGSPPTDIAFGLSSMWSVEVDARNADKSADGNNGVIITPVSGKISIAIKNYGASTTYGAFSYTSSSGSTQPDAPAWDPSQYQGVRYWFPDASKCTEPQSTEAPLCEKISQFIVTSNGATNTYLCPDGECRVDLITGAP